MSGDGKKHSAPEAYASNFTPGRRRMLARRLKTVPFPNFLGIKLREMRAGRVALSFQVTGDLKQYQGFLHGGAITSLADTAASFAALTVISDDLDLITVDIKGNFLATVDKGAVRAEAEVVHMGRRTSVIECSLYGRNRRLLWHGLFTCLHFPSDMNRNG